MAVKAARDGEWGRFSKETRAYLHRVGVQPHVLLGLHRSWKPSDQFLDILSLLTKGIRINRNGGLDDSNVRKRIERYNSRFGVSVMNDGDDGTGRLLNALTNESICLR
jgi:hypothetical protein